MKKLVVLLCHARGAEVVSRAACGAADAAHGTADL
ncbi:hypothetical protein A2U01_0114831, partial [Trifolium medium]|nr:hypothetical protein [Trifolium medium]